MDTKGPILALRLGGLGDLLVVLPSLRLLRRSRPGLPLTLVGRESYGRLFKDEGLVEEVVSSEAGLLAGLFSDDPASPALSAWLESFSEVWGWMRRESGGLRPEDLLNRGASRVHFIGLPVLGSPIPFFEHYYRRTAAALGDPDPPALGEGEAWFLREPAGRTRGGAPGAVPDVVIHPGGGAPSKCWPLERYLGIMEKLAARGRGGLLVTGEAEERLDRKLVKVVFPPGWSWLNRPPLTELAAVLQACAFYLGNDSGVTHLAAACGAPGLALFLERNELSWRPFGRVRVLSAVQVEAISPGDVWAAVDRLMKCT